MKRWISFLFGIFAYAFGLGSLVLFMLFVGGWTSIPGLGKLRWQMDAAATSPYGHALAVNLGLIGLFGLQHSLMARPAFKRVWTRIVSTSLERSLYVVATGIVICLICMLWQPLAGTVWHVRDARQAAMLTGLQLLGWTIVVASSFMISHFELFGLQQVYYRLIDQPAPKPNFTVKYLYRYVRHPLQMGMLIGIWSTPHMSTSHMLLSAAMTLYITVGLYLEERDLATFLGQDYEHYRQQVPMIVPLSRGISSNAKTPGQLSTDSAST